MKKKSYLVLSLAGLVSLGIAAIFAADTPESNTAKPSLADTAFSLENIKDHNGNNLLIRATKGYDVTKIYENEDGDLLVYVSGTIKNVSRELGLKTGDIHSIGILTQGGADLIDVEGLPTFAGGIQKDTNEVIKAGTIERVDPDAGRRREWVDEGIQLPPRGDPLDSPE